MAEVNINKLGEAAGPIVNMLLQVFAKDGQPNYERSLLFAAGLAGYACHKAVWELYPELFEIAATDKGKRYYFGDAVNKFMYEGKYSVTNFCSGIYHHMEPDKPVPDYRVIAEYIVTQIGNEKYGIWHKYKPEEVYPEIKSCWNGIYPNMTAPYCTDAAEWPVLYGIVLENIMKYAMESGLEALNATKEEVYMMAIECAGFLSKMDDDSI